MLGNIEYKCGLTHGRSGSYKDEIRRLQACSHIIQGIKTGGHTCDAPLILGSLGDTPQLFHRYFINGSIVRTTVVLKDIEHILFSTL